jgi:hypothetical protein
MGWHRQIDNERQQSKADRGKSKPDDALDGSGNLKSAGNRRQDERIGQEASLANLAGGRREGNQNQHGI